MRGLVLALATYVVVFALKLGATCGRPAGPASRGGATHRGDRAWSCARPNRRAVLRDSDRTNGGVIEKGCIRARTYASSQLAV
jgi:hypothetical protein